MNSKLKKMQWRWRCSVICHYSVMFQIKNKQYFQLNIVAYKLVTKKPPFNNIWLIFSGNMHRVTKSQKTSIIDTAVKTSQMTVLRSYWTLQIPRKHQSLIPLWNHLRWLCSSIILNVTSSQKISVTDTTVKASQMTVFFDHTVRYKFLEDISHWYHCESISDDCFIRSHWTVQSSRRHHSLIPPWKLLKRQCTSTIHSNTCSW
jgi:hypothetical protein